MNCTLVSCALLTCLDPTCTPVVPGEQSRADSDDSDDGASGDFGVQRKTLLLEQVQILDPEGHMKVVYPSRIDLSSDNFQVERDF